LGVKIFWSRRSEDWCSNVVKLNPVCRWCVDGVVWESSGGISTCIV